MRLANAPANTLATLESIACETGEAARASELYRESLEPVRRFVFRYKAVACLEGLARVAAMQMQGQPEQAARLLGASAALREEMGTSLSPIAQVDHDHAVNAARAALSEDAIAAALAEGHTMSSFEEAIAHALGDDE